MQSIETSSEGFFARVRRWLKSQIVGEVPVESALCEYDCRKQQCHYGEWATCERRLSQAAGEFMPKRSRDEKT